MTKNKEKLNRELQEERNKQSEADKYIQEHCVFNKKNL